MTIIGDFYDFSWKISVMIYIGKITFIWHLSIELLLLSARHRDLQKVIREGIIEIKEVYSRSRKCSLRSI